MVKTTEGVGLIPSRGTKSQHAAWYSQKLKEKKKKVTKGLPLDFFPPSFSSNPEETKCQPLKNIFHESVKHKYPTSTFLPFLDITLEREQKQT